jgi:anti-sigma B factor antagonist
MTDFQVSITPVSSNVVVRLVGDASLTTVEKLRDALKPVLASNAARVVIDMADLAFINSLGLGVILEFRHQLGDAKKLRLSGARQSVADILKRTRLVDLFPMYESPSAALAS